MFQRFRVALVASCLAVGAAGAPARAEAPAASSDRAQRAVEENRAGTLLSQQQDFAGALERYRKAIELDPTVDLFLANAGAASWWLGQRDEAVAYYTRAVDVAAAARAYDRIAAYHQYIRMVRYVLPPDAEAKRQAASAVPPGREQALAEWQGLASQVMASFTQGRYADAVEPARAALELARARFGPDHPHTLLSASSLGDLHRFQGEHDEALALYQDAHRRAVAVYGAGHPDTLTYLFNVASVLQLMDRGEEARASFEDLVERSRATLGDAHPLTLTYGGGLAGCYVQLKLRELAAPLLDKTLKAATRVFGREHPDTLTVITNLAGLRQLQGRGADARALAEEALLAARKILGPGHPTTEAYRASLVEMCENQGLLAELLRIHEETLRYRRVVLSDDDLMIAAALTSVADAHLRRGEYAEAEGLYAEALRRSRELVGERGPDTIVCMSNLGLLYHQMGRYEEARELLEAAAATAVAELGPDNPGTFSAKNNLALLLGALGEYQRSRRLYEEVLAGRRRVFGEEDPETWRSMHNLALDLSRGGLQQEAQPLLEEVLRLRQEHLSPDHPLTLLSLNALGIVLVSRGLYSEAQPLFEEALRRREATLGDNHPDTLISLANLGSLLMSQDRRDRAKPVLEEVLRRRKAVLGERHPLVADALASLGVLASDEGDQGRAQALFEASAKLRRELFGPEHPDTLIAVNNLASLASMRGDTAKAIAMLDEAVAGAKAGMGPEHPTTLVFMANLALAYSGAGRRDESRALYEEVVAAEKRVLGPYHPEVLATQSLLASVYEISGMLAEADRTWDDQFEQTGRFLELVLWGADDQTRSSYLDGQRPASAAALSYFARRGTPEASRRMLEHALERKGMLLAIASGVHAATKASADPKLKGVATTLAARRSELAALAVAGPMKRTPEAHEARMRELGREIEELEARLGRFAEAAGRARRVVTPDQVSRALGEDGVLVDFLAFSWVAPAEESADWEVLVAVVLDPKAEPPVRVVLLGDLRPIAKDVRAYGQALGLADRSAPPSYLDQLARALYDRLWAPLVPHLRGGRATVYLVPDGALHLLPFAALKDPEGRYLVQTQDFVLLTSGRDLVQQPAAPSTEPALVLASPSYDHPDPPPAQGAAGQRAARTSGRSLRDVYFGPLPGTAREGQEIARLLGERNLPVIVRAALEATEQALMAQPRPRLLHLATHGFFLEGQPETRAPTSDVRGLMLRPKPTGAAAAVASPHAALQQQVTGNPLLRSGLALTGANLGVLGVEGAAQPGGSDGILTAMEVLALDLVGTQLVVLSACQTGLGEVRPGEGVYGLRRAFMEAGARAVLSTLWSVDDEGTRAFMERFYTHFLGGASAPEAVRRAQRELIESERWRHPNFWAPFVVVGR